MNKIGAKHRKINHSTLENPPTLHDGIKPMKLVVHHFNINMMANHSIVKKIRPVYGITFNYQSPSVS